MTRTAWYLCSSEQVEDTPGERSTLANATEKKSHPVLPTLVTDGVGEDLPRRCGRFSETAHDHDRELLFLETLHGTFQKQRGKSITSFFVRMSVHFAFFGARLSIGKQQESARGRGITCKLCPSVAIITAKPIVRLLLF